MTAEIVSNWLDTPYEDVVIFRFLFLKSEWRIIVDGFLILKMPGGKILMFDNDNKLRAILEPHKHVFDD